MSTLRVYRIVVDSWPTPDGRPWCRFYGYDAQHAGRLIDPYDDSYDEDIPEWLEKRIAWAREQTHGALRGTYMVTPYADPFRIIERLREGDADWQLGVLMPKRHRVNYLSASGARELARDMRAFGAQVRVLRSEPVVWVEEP